MNQIVNRSGFALAPSSMSEALQMAEMLSKSGMVPKAYQGKPQDTLVAMMMGNEVGLNPIQSLQNIAVINGKPSIYGDALAALVQNHPAFGGMEESFNESGNVATCTVWRRGGTKHTQTFSQADATKAGLWNKSGPWSQYPKRMLAMRARGFALRSQFADALAGLITREEAEDMPLQDYESPPAISGPVDTVELVAISDEANIEDSKESPRMQAHNAVLRSQFATISAIKSAVAENNYYEMAAQMDSLSDEEKTALWVAPSKGGIFTTAERAAFKSNEYNSARADYFAEKQTKQEVVK